MENPTENYDPGSIFVEADSSSRDKRDAHMLLHAEVVHRLRYFARHVPLSTAEQAQAIVLFLAPERAIVATTNPENGVLLMKVAKCLKLGFVGSIEPWHISPEQYDELQAAIYGDTGRQTQVREIRPIYDWTDVGDQFALSALDTQPSVEEDRDLQLAAVDVNLQDQSLTELSQLARRILLEANARGASDIFVESGENIGRICFRQDGLVNLHIQNIPPPVIRQLVNIFANMAGVSSHELHLKIVDGNLTLRGVPTSRGPINADYRCCFTPTRRGVDLTLRNNFEEVRPIKDIGFEDDTLSAVLMALGRPQGLILLCGPTGQGKSITREAMLRILEDRQCLKIFEWGNPIEFPSERRTQVEIDRSSQLTWEEVSKAALRCSPNVITPSEFRDDTEAQWVVKASATGHLVITTFHATNIAAAFTRLMHLQVRPYDLAEHLTAVVSQRLVRLLCPYCKVPDAGAQALGYPNAYTSPQELVHTRARVAIPWQKVDPRSSLADVQVIGKAEGPVNCPHCADEGYRGRTAVLEVLYVTPMVQELIFQLDHPAGWSSRQASPVTGAVVFERARREAKSNGLNLITLEEAAANKVHRGLTSVSEVKRVLAVSPVAFFGGEVSRTRSQSRADLRTVESLDSEEGELNVKSSAGSH